MGVGCIKPRILNLSELDGGELLASNPGYSTPREKALVTHWIRGLKAHRYVHKSPPFDPHLSQLNPVRNFTTYFFKNHFTSIYV